MNLRPRHHLLLAIAALLVACGSSPPVVVPDPATEIPDTFTAVEPSATNQPLREDWWTTFNDQHLDELVTTCLEHNHDVQAAFARLQAASALRTIAGADAWPAVDAGLDAGRARRLFLGFPFGGDSIPSSTTTTFGLSLSVRWELDLWGRVRAGDSSAIADVEAARADFAGAQLSLVGQACRTWFATVEARAQLALAEATVTAFRGTYEDVRDRYRRGVRPPLDVHQAATNLAAAEASVEQRAEVLQRTLRQLDVLAGRYPRGATAVPTELPTTLPAIPGALPGELLQRRPDLVAAERRLAAAGCRVDAARAGLYPRLALTGTGGTSSEELEDLVDQDFRIWSIGANLLAPLFRGGALQAEVLRNEARAAEAAADYGSTVLRAFFEVEDVLATDVRLQTRRDRLAEAAGHARSAQALARQRYQAGLADFLAVADSQRQSFLADSARIAIDRQRLENRIDLFLSLGGGYRRDDSGARP